MTCCGARTSKPSARQNLRQAFPPPTPGLGQDVISTGEMVFLQPGALTSEVTRFEREAGHRFLPRGEPTVAKPSLACCGSRLACASRRAFCPRRFRSPSFAHPYGADRNGAEQNQTSSWSIDDANALPRGDPYRSLVHIVTERRRPGWSQRWSCQCRTTLAHGRHSRRPWRFRQWRWHNYGADEP